MAQVPESDRQLFGFALEPILLVDGRTRVLAANPAACALWSLSAGELEGRAVVELFHPDDRPALRDLLGMSATVATATVRLRALLDDGLTIPVDGRAAQLPGAGGDDQGGGSRMLALRDMGAIDAMERELAFARETAISAPRHLAGLTTTISHELRLPLNVIAGAAELISRGKLDPEQLRHAETMRLSIEFMADMVSELLTFSRLEAAEDFRLDALSFIPEQTVDWVLRMLVERADAKGLSLERRLDPLAGMSLLGRGPWIRRVLMNLVGNAIKFTEKGHVEVSTVSEPVGEDRVRIRFQVRDTGPGFEQEDLAQLFLPFRQFNRSPEVNMLGTGLGLSICKRLVEAMGGEISITSTPGQGALASFEVEFARAGRPAAGPNGEGTAAQVGDAVAYVSCSTRARQAGGTRVLVVEDNALCRDVLMDMLRYLGCEADAVGGGGDALATLDRERYDVVLVDCNLPDMSGCELIRQVRAPDRVNRPGIIVIPGGGLKSCVQAEVYDAVPKPISMGRLSMALRPWLERQVARPQGRPPPFPDGQGAWGGGKPPASLLEVFTVDLHERFGLTRDAAELGDLETILREAHAIRGGSMQLGAARLVTEVERLSELARNGDIAGVRQLVQCIADIIPDELKRFR